MNRHSPLAILRRNHLPIVSILGCISCLYIISQKDAINTQVAAGHGESGDQADGWNILGRAVGKPAVGVPLVLDEKHKSPVEGNIRNVEKERSAEVKEQPGPVEAVAAPPAVPEAPAKQEAPAQPPPDVAAGGDQSGPAISYDDPERVKFPGYEQCAKVDFQPEHAMPLVALATYMSSGDVVIRQRLQSATGIYTGTWNEAEAGYPRSKSGVFLGSTIDYKLGRTVVAKTQIAQPDHIVTFEGGAVLVIRNPHTMIIAEFMRRKIEEDRSKQPTPQDIAGWFQQPDWKTFFETEVGNWRSFAIQWITYAKRLIVVSYEYFFENPVPETTRIIVFLNVHQDDARISCSIQAYPRDHIDKMIDFDPFTDDMKAKVATYVKEVNQTIITRGLRPLPDWKNTF